MSIRSHHITVALLAVVAGCQPTRADPPASGSSSTESPTLSSPRALEVLSGPIEVSASAGGRHRLLVDRRAGPTLDGAGRGRLDTGGLEDGLHLLQLARPGATAPLGAAVPVIVLNRGSEVFFKDGSEGMVDAAPCMPGLHDESGHRRYHWDMTAGVKQVLGLLTWTGGGDGFELELALGTGSCPHSGRQLAHAQSARSPLTVLFRPSSGELPAGQWFAHVRAARPDAADRRSASFRVRAFLLR
jgi:hypothetical protein